MAQKSSHARRKGPAERAALNRAAAVVRRSCPRTPRVGFILGSGFQGVLKAVRVATDIPWERFAGFPKPTVPGHSGRLVCGTLGGLEVAILAGRLHYYEGHEMETVVLGVRLLAQLGVESVVVTSAAGGVNPRFRVGDFMLITDHINLMGVNPLRGLPSTAASPFVDMTHAYDPGLQTLFRGAARQTTLRLRRGVYLAVSGPSYETPAEIRAFRQLGADAVGMSTVHEAMALSAMGGRVCGLSLISNLAAGLAAHRLSHDEVLAAGEQAREQLIALVTGFCGRLAQLQSGQP